MLWNPTQTFFVCIGIIGLVSWFSASAINVVKPIQRVKVPSSVAQNPNTLEYSEDDELVDYEAYAAAQPSLAQFLNTEKRVKRDTEFVCYGDLGCFPEEAPFDYLGKIPSSPDEIETKFFLFNRLDQSEPFVFTYYNYTSLNLTVYNETLPTKIIIHGFVSNCGRSWATEMRVALLAVVQCNVICLDWRNGARLPNYVQAAANTRLVGKQLALLLKHLEGLGSQPQDFHLIGFSLGAHVAGYAGTEIGNLSRITGLDPAGPLYESYDKRVRLDEDDANFVDVIHSNGDSLINGGMGSWEPMGHVDFYPNGGRIQKGCSNSLLGTFRGFLWSTTNEVRRLIACNHRRAYKLFTESISRRCPFRSFPCDSYEKYVSGNCFGYNYEAWGNMGYFADQLPARGSLYLTTREEEPFCANQYKIQLDFSPSPDPISTHGGIQVILTTNSGLNETFLLSTTGEDRMAAGESLSKLIVTHPAVVDVVEVTLKYTAYNGWVVSGTPEWSLERIQILDSYATSSSFCDRLLLQSGIPVAVALQHGLCH